jgi:hypothetical protein
MPKPTQVRKAPNRDPTSLAISIANPNVEPIFEPIVESALNPIDPQLLLILDVNVDVNVDVNINYSPFSDAIPSPTLNILSYAPSSIQSNPFKTTYNPYQLSTNLYNNDDDAAT